LVFGVGGQGQSGERRKAVKRVRNPEPEKESEGNEGGKKEHRPSHEE